MEITKHENVVYFVKNPENKQISGNFIEYYQIINIYEFAVEIVEKMVKL